jgi:hypothetical protein
MWMWKILTLFSARIESASHIKVHLAKFVIFVVVLNIKFKLVSFCTLLFAVFVKHLYISRFQFSKVNLHTSNGPEVVLVAMSARCPAAECRHRSIVRP